MNKLQTSFLGEFMFSYRTLGHTNIKMLVLFHDATSKFFTNIMLPMLELDTNYGFHELFLNCSSRFVFK